MTPSANRILRASAFLVLVSACASEADTTIGNGGGGGGGSEASSFCCKADGGCECDAGRVWTCYEPGGSVCQCGFGPSPFPNTISTCDTLAGARTCCLSGDGDVCYCDYADACVAGEIAVSDCADASTLGVELSPDTCSSWQTETSSCGQPHQGGQCESEEFGTTYAGCESDGDCYGGYCNADCTPGPCCEPATDSVIDEGRSYTCSADSDCEAVAPDFVSRGGTASCYTASNFSSYSVCVFNCP